MAGRPNLRVRKCSEDFQKFFRRFAARGGLDLEAELERGKARSFVEQDKGPAVRCGIFAGFLNELAAFSPRRRP
jgi:hypothetical protein